jgi:flagellar assembly protein FliH
MSDRRSALLFADDFDDTEVVPAAAVPIVQKPPPPSYGQGDLEVARAEGHADGYALGTADAARSYDAQTAVCIATLSERMSEASKDAARVAEENADEFGKLLFSILVAGFPRLRAIHGEEELQGLVRRALPGLMREAHVTFHVNPAMAHSIEANLAGVPPKERQCMTIVPTDAVAFGDGRIVWPNGALIRDTEAIRVAVSGILASLGLLSEPLVGTTETQPR